MSFGIIYRVINESNGKVYIGQTVRGLHERRRKHNYSKEHSHFHRAIRKYGKNNFKWKMLEECDSQEQLNNRERYYIKKYNSLKNGYNMTAGGGVMTGWNHSDETKHKISLKSREWYSKNEHPNKGRVWPEEFKRKISAGHTGKKLSDEHKNKISKRSSGKNNPMYGLSGSRSPAAKNYKIIFPDGSEEIINCLKTFCETHELNQVYMSGCATGRCKQHKGYKCEYFREVVI